MYFNGDTLHFRLNELLGVCSIVSIFDKSLSYRLKCVYHYHKDLLKEHDLQPLQLTNEEVERFHLEKFISHKVIQPEFVFSDDDEIF